MRLLEQLPRRTHLRPAPRPQGGARVHRKRVETGRGRGGANKRAIRVGAKTYSSIKTARAALGVGNAKLRRWLADGTARYG
jgi:hypothetical protein